MVPSLSGHHWARPGSNAKSKPPPREHPPTPLGHLPMNSISAGVTCAEGLSAGRLFAETLFAEAKKKEGGKGRPFTHFWARPKHQQICLVFFLCQHLCRGSICGEILCGGKKRETFYCFQKRMDPGSCVGDGLLGSLFSQAGVQEANEVRCDIKILCGRGVAAK